MIQAAQQNGDTANAEKWMQTLMSSAQSMGIPLK